MFKYKISEFKSKILKNCFAGICMFALLLFVVGVYKCIESYESLGLLLSIDGVEQAIHSAYIGLNITIVSGIMMLLLHIIYFSTPQRLKKVLFK